MAKKANTSSKIIQSVDRALEILDCFNEYTTELQLAEICERLSLNKSTALGIINTMIRRGYLDKNLTNGRYRLGKVLLSKQTVSQVATSNKLNEVGRVYLKRLSVKHGTNAYLMGYSNNILYPSDQIISDDPELKTIEITSYRLMLHAAASGKLVLAHYTPFDQQRYLSSANLVPFTPNTHTDPETILKDVQEIRERGYSIEMEEVDPGIMAISMPIYDQSGELRAAISCSGRVSRMQEFREDIVKDLRQYSKEISEKVF